MTGHVSASWRGYTAPMSDVQYEQVRSPFQPGFGRAPPLLAGREDEQSRLAGKLLMLQHGDAPNPDLLSAPRGMGKTVLLNWLQRQAQGQGVETLQTATSDVPGADAPAPEGTKETTQNR